MKKIILIVTSDPDSINFEIIKKSLFFFKKKIKNNYIFIGHNNAIFNNLKKRKNIGFVFVKKSNDTKKYLSRCFNKAFELLKSKKAHALINLPLNKKNLPKRFFGFTEYISDYFKLKNKETMLLFNHKFSVCPNTTHIPLKKVHLFLNKEKIVNNINNINFFYKKFIGIKKPSIGLMGLNPHNGIDMRKNNEEKNTILPAINIAKKNGIKIFGPLSPDTAFNKIKTNKFHSLIGNYHDQVLPTFKYINNFNAINITLGLPFLRVSLDHGTGKDIKGKNKAKPDSFLYALNFFEKYSKKI